MDRAAPLTLICLFLATLSGCLDADVDTEGDPEPGATNTPMEPFTIPVEGDRCTLQAQVFLLEPETLFDFLPPGYFPADAGMILGSPAASGQGGAAIGTIDCLDSALGPHRWGVVIIMVKEPTVAGLPSQPQTMHMYAPFWTATGDDFVAAMRTVDLEPEAYDVSFDTMIDGADLQGDVLRGVAAVSAGWTDAQGVSVFTGTTASAVAYEFPGIERYRIWTDTPGGTTVFDIDLVEDSDVNDLALGLGAADCRIQGGSFAAEVMGATSCEEAQAIGYSWLHTAVAGEGWMHSPGHHA